MISSNNLIHYLYIIVLLLLCLSGYLLIRLYKLKKKNLTKQNETNQFSVEKINKLYGDLLREEKKLVEGKFTDDAFNKTFKKFADLIGKGVSAEVLILGRIDGETMVDKGFYTAFERTKSISKSISKIKQIPIHESIIYTTLKNNETYYSNKNSESGKLIELEFQKKAEHNINIYNNEILKSGQLKEILALGLSANDSLFGYIIALNSVSQNKLFGKQDKILLENVKFSIENHYTSVLNEKTISEQEKTISEQEKDDKFFRNAFLINDIEDLFSNILRRLNKDFNCYLASYWMLAKNGTKELDSVVLLRKYILEKDYEQYDNQILHTSYEIATKSHAGSLLLEGMNYKSTAENIIKVYNTSNSINQKFLWNFLPSNEIIVIPVFESTDHLLNDKQKLLGVICLRPRDINKLSHDYKNHLFSFSQNLQSILEKTIYKKRYEKLNFLSEMENEINIQDSDEKFFNALIEFLLRISSAQDVSIFLLDSNNKHLYLKDSSAKYFYEEEKNGNTNIYEAINYIKDKNPIYNLNIEDDFSYTAKSVVEQEVINIFDIWGGTKANLKFMEKTSSKHKSILLIPLVDGMKKSLGVIRCVNKIKEPNSIFDYFAQSDTELLKVAGVIIASHISMKIYSNGLTKALAKIGHESRQPIAGASAKLGILKLHLRLDNIYNTKYEKTFDDIKSEIKLIANNINNIDDVYRKSEIVMTYEPVLITKIIKEVIDSFNRRIRTRIKPYFELNPTLYVNASKIRQVIYNLISNSIQYAEKGTIKIFFRRDIYINEIGSEYFRIDFEDFGIGIPNGDENRIFTNEGFRSENAKDQYVTGSGIGLKISSNIIEKHGGYLRVFSNKNPTIISILLPIYLIKRKPNII